MLLIGEFLCEFYYLVSRRYSLKHHATKDGGGCTNHRFSNILIIGAVQLLVESVVQTGSLLQGPVLMANSLPISEYISIGSEHFFYRLNRCFILLKVPKV